VGLDAGGEVGLADVVGERVLVEGEVWRGTVGAEAAVGQGCLQEGGRISMSSVKRVGSWKLEVVRDERRHTGLQSLVGASLEQRVSQAARWPMHQEACCDGQRRSM